MVCARAQQCGGDPVASGRGDYLPDHIFREDRRSSGVEEIAMTMRAIAVSLLMLASAPAVADPSQSSTCAAPKRLTSVDMIMDPGGNIAIPVQINGLPFRFGVDTGNVYTVVATSVSQYLNFSLTPLRAKFTLMGGVSSSVAGRSQSFTVGTLGAPKFAFVIMPDFALGDIGNDGLLGPDIMSTYDVDIDFAHAKFNLFSPDHCPGDVVYWTKSEYQKVPIELEDDWHITTPVVMDGKQLTATVDTGAANTVLSLGAAESVFGITLTSPGLTKIGDFRINGSDPQALYSYSFHELSIGGITIHDPRIIIAQDNELGSGAKLLLGLTTLRQFHMYIAYKERMLYLTPAEAQ
jgi:predicted aspartyl protease